MAKGNVPFLFYASALCIPLCINGHGSMVDPPQRGVMWKYGFNTPKNYNYNGLNCGGFQNQWVDNGGRCGLCGDPYMGERDHEDGGIFATGKVAKTYTSGSTIKVKVILTANHRGWFEFRLCSRNFANEKLSQACLDRHLLSLPDGKTRYFPGFHSENEVTLQLPEGVTCRQCVLQWKYNAGNSWGCFGRSKCCMGCGAQEQFRNCADVAIIAKDEGNSADLNRLIQTQENPKPKPVFTTKVQTYNTGTTRENSDNNGNTKEKVHHGMENIWNENNISRESDNVISGSTNSKRLRKLILIKSALSKPFKRILVKCRSTGVWKTVSGMDIWCRRNCGPNVFKPSPGCTNYCKCTV